MPPQQPAQKPAELARHTVSRIKEALDSGKSASLSQIVQLIQEITSRAETISVQGLADIISRDLATMTKTISLANTLGFNPTGAPVGTVNQAIQVIGFENIRNLAISLMLMENVEGKLTSVDGQEIAALALTSGLLAKTIGERSACPEPEQAFVCAALRSYGKLLLAAFLGSEYERATDLSRDVPVDQAFREVFGMTPLDLSLELLQATQLPDIVLDTLRELPKNLPVPTARSGADQLLVTCDFATKLCQMVDDPSFNPKDFEQAAEQLMSQYGKTFPFTGKDMVEIIQEVNRALSALAQAHGVRTLSSTLVKKLNALAEGRDFAFLPPRARRKQAEQAAPGPPQANPQEVFRKGMEELARIAASSGPRDLSRLLACALGIIRDGLCLSQCIIFTRDSDLRHYSARFGVGPLFDRIQFQPLLTPENRDVFKICLSRGEDVLIQNPCDPNIRPFIPAWLKPSAGSNPLVLLSFKDGQETFAVVCGCGSSQESLGLTTKFAQELRALRNCFNEVRHRT